MYEARQHKEKVNRRIGGNIKEVRQRVKINDFKTVQFAPTYTLLITGAPNWAVTQNEAMNVVSQISGATFSYGKGLQGGGYLAIINTVSRDIDQIGSDVQNVNHNVTVKAGNHYNDYY